MKESIYNFLLIIIVSITSVYSQTKDVKIWVQNNNESEYIQVYFDALYSSEVGPHWISPGQIQAFIVKELTKIRISIGRQILYRETKDLKYFNQIRYSRMFQVNKYANVSIITGQELDLQMKSLPQDFKRY